MQRDCAMALKFDIYENVKIFDLGWQEHLDKDWVDIKRYGDSVCQHQGREDGRQRWIQGLAGDVRNQRKAVYSNLTFASDVRNQRKAIYSNLLFADYSSELSFPWWRRSEAIQLLHNIKLYAGMFMEGQNLQVIFLNILKLLAYLIWLLDQQRCQSDSCSTGSRKDVWLSAVEYSLRRWILNVLGRWHRLLQPGFCTALSSSNLPLSLSTWHSGHGKDPK